MEFFTKIVDFIVYTQVGKQFKEVDFGALFTNPWFLVPFICLIGYLLYKQNFKEIILIIIGFALLPYICHRIYEYPDCG